MMAAIVNSLYTLCGCHALLFHSCCSLSSCPHSRLPSTPLTLLVCFLSALSTPLCLSPLTILPALPALSSPFPVSLPSHPSTLFFKTPPHLPLRTHTVCANPLRPTFIGKALYTYHYIRDTECPLPRQRNSCVSQHTLELFGPTRVRLPNHFDHLRRPPHPHQKRSLTLHAFTGHAPSNLRTRPPSPNPLSHAHHPHSPLRVARRKLPGLRNGHLWGHCNGPPDRYDPRANVFF